MKARSGVGGPPGGLGSDDRPALASLAARDSRSITESSQDEYQETPPFSRIHRLTNFACSQDNAETREEPHNWQQQSCGRPLASSATAQAVLSDAQGYFVVGATYADPTLSQRDTAGLQKKCKLPRSNEQVRAGQSGQNFRVSVANRPQPARFSENSPSQNPATKRATS